MSTQPPVKIGEAWAGEGGIFAGTLRNPETKEIHHIIMHPQAAQACEWGTYGKKIDSANSYWHGAANTAAMRASEHCSEIINAIAALPSIDGHTDYYIPAQAELNILCCNLRDMVEPNWHWSSTQYSSGSAWSQGFEYGGQYIDSKGLQLAVRAVRRILAI